MIRRLVVSAITLAATCPALAGALHEAVGSGDASAVRAALQSGADIDELDGSGKAPLHIAAEKNDAALIELLVSNGADPDRIAEGFYGPSDAPIHSAVKRRSLDAIRALHRAGANLTLATINTAAPLHLALKAGRDEAAQLLISLGADSFEAEDIGGMIAGADTDTGAEYAGACKSCHSLEMAGDLDKDGLVGPPIWNIVGSPKATYPGYEYSPAIKQRGGVWTYRELNNMIANPTAFMPGTKMEGTGVSIKDPQRRAQIIAYLRLLSDEPFPLPE